MLDERHLAYTGDRPEARAIVPPHAHEVLDVGCSAGTVGLALKANGHTVTGIELATTLADKATEVLDDVIRADAGDGLRALASQGRRFNAILFLDVLEHLEDPWAAVAAGRDVLAPGGCFVISLPNVTHWTTYAAMLHGTWPRRERGIHDSTHLRFFGRRDVRSLVEGVDLRIDTFRRIYRARETAGRFDGLAGVLGRLWPDGFTYQFLVRAVDANEP